MRDRQSRPATLARLKGHGLIEIDLETARDRTDHLIYGLRPRSGFFVCEPFHTRSELENLVGDELTFFGYGQSELGLYTLTADVCLADRRDFPRVSLRVMRIHNAQVVHERQLLRAS